MPQIASQKSAKRKPIYALSPLEKAHIATVLNKVQTLSDNQTKEIPAEDDTSGTSPSGLNLS